MCGRYSLTHKPDVVMMDEEPFVPRYNIAPTQTAFVIPEPGKARAMTWGFPPAGSTPLVINARGETLAQKPLFSMPLTHQRCLVPADGFYEWKKEGKRRHPMRIVPQQDPLFMFAGLWIQNRNADRPFFCIITTAANQKMARLHDRMPLILPAEGQAQWLDPGASLDQLLALVKPAPDPALDYFQVDPAVSDVKSEGPQCFAKASAVQGELW